MRYTDNILLGRYARLQLEIAIAKNPTAQMNIDRDTIRKSVGYKKLRAWFLRMSPRKRVDARRWLQQQCDGIEQIKKLCAQTGEDPATLLADIEIIHRDDRGDVVEPISLPDARDAIVEGSEATPEELERERETAETSKASLLRAMRESVEAIRNSGQGKP